MEGYLGSQQGGKIGEADGKQTAKIKHEVKKKLMNAAVLCTMDGEEEEEHELKAAPSPRVTAAKRRRRLGHPSTPDNGRDTDTAHKREAGLGMT